MSARVARVVRPSSASPVADVLWTRGQVLAERDRKPDARAEIRLTRFQALHHRRRQVPLRRWQPRPQPLGQRRSDREHADAARARDPLSRRRVHRVGADRAVDVPERLRGVDHQRHAEARGTPRQARDPAARCRGGLPARSGAPVPAGRQRASRRLRRPSTRPRASTGSARTSKPLAAITARLGPYSPGRQATVRWTGPAAQQQIQRVVGAGGVHDVGRRHPGQRGDGRAARVERRVRRPARRRSRRPRPRGGRAAAAASMTAKLCREQAPLSRCSPATFGRAARHRSARVGHLVGQRQPEVARLVGPPVRAPQPAAASSAATPAGPELARHLGEHLLAGRELDGQVQRRDPHPLRRARRAATSRCAPRRRSTGRRARRRRDRSRRRSSRFTTASTLRLNCAVTPALSS